MSPADSDRLAVWHGDMPVGELWRDDQDRIGFEYQHNWITRGFSIGRVLPLRAAPFEPADGLAHAWFSNLLPEGLARETIVRHLGTVDDDFTLLRKIGGDCAGALSILPLQERPTDVAGSERLDERRFRFMLQGRQGTLTTASVTSTQMPRLSLAGAQAKTPVLIRDGEFHLPVGATASSHILKFEQPQWRNVPIYELLLNRLALAAGLPVAETRMEQRHDRRFLIVSRYDREYASGTWKRLHQEDFCQIAGLRATRKYQADGGPGLDDCARWIRQLSESPAQDLLHLLRWQIFNWLAGNSDGHAKNLAMLQVRSSTDRWRLAPFYDLVCTRAWRNLDRRLAMDVGGESDPGRIRERHWQVLANQLGMAPRFVVQEVTDMTQTIDKKLSQVRADLETGHGPLPMLQQALGIIGTQLRIAKNMS